jgi:antirestriction protein ArdC/5S rRNA maturation endonuclease (ribonuclease M5)
MGDAFYRQKDKLLEIRQTLKSVIDGYKEDPDKIAELLEFKSRFWNYSLNNSILILSQNSAATFVASYRGWNQKGYHVRKGQHGIKVLYPIRIELIPLGEKNGKQQYRRVSHATPEEKAQIASGELKTVTYTRFGVGTVFDISQTDCPPEDYPRFYSMGYSSKQHAELYQAVKQFAESKGVPVKETDLHSISLRGAFYPKENVIRISDKLNDTERLSTLTHELGHALMHSSKEALKLPAPVAELEADAISIMLQKHFGIDLTDSRKRHLTDNYRACAKLKDFDLTAVLKAVNKAYYGLRKEMDPVLENPDQKMPEKKQALERYDPEDNQYRVRSHTQITKFNDICEKPINTAAQQPKKKMVPPQHPAPRQYDNEKSGDVLDYIKQDVSLLTVAKDMGFTPVKTGGYYSLKEHDSIRIYPETNSYYQFSAGTGGSPIDFVMHLGGYSKEEAVRRLKEQYVGNRLDSLPPVKKKNPPEPKKKEFILPDKAQGKYRHAFAYLVKTRCIDSAIVGQCIKEGLIYEDNKHNVVFVGKDETGKAAFATRHTSMTGSSFKRDVAGSRQDLGWMVKSPKARKLYVCEAPIDALSIMTLMKQQGKAVENASYLATCGTCKDSAVYTRLRENPQTQVVVLANDNDFAGRKANQKIYENLQKKYPKIRVRLLNPKRGKDINECLCHISTPKERIQDEEVER